MTYIYNPPATLKEVKVFGKDLLNKPYQKKEEYGYDDRGWLATVKITDAGGITTLQKTYKYLTSGRQSLYQESDATGRITLLLQYEYKKHFMDRGRQVSYLNTGNME
jgi:hypothetical protein